MNTQQLAISAQDAITLANTLLPILEASSPSIQKNAQQIQLITNAASILANLIQNIPQSSGVISADAQQTLLDKVNLIISGKVFSGEEWKKQE